MNRQKTKEIKLYLKAKNIDINSPEGKKAYKLCKKLFTSKDYNNFRKRYIESYDEIDNT